MASEENFLDGRHSFYIERITHIKELYDGISLENELKRFDEVVKEHFGVQE